MTRFEKIARVLTITLCGLISLTALFTSYSNYQRGESWMMQFLDGVILLGVCIGCIKRKTWGPILYALLALFKAGGLLQQSHNPASFFGGLVGLIIPLIIAFKLMKAFSKLTEAEKSPTPSSPKDLKKAS